jgi:gelsolin
MTGQVKLEDSNMANYRSEEFKEMKMEVIKKEPAWKGAGEKKGIEVWRIEKFKVKRWAKERYGEFFGGDSYIILNTKESDEGKLSWDVYFWLGAETSQDEAGTAAYKTVEIDDLLGDDPVQFREVQGNESKCFLSLFPKMTILSGGIESGFNHVKPKEYKPRLLHVTGFKKHVQVYQVPIKKESLNDSDCFVLDAGLTIFQFNGTKSSGWEKRKAGAIIAELKAARHGKVKETYVIDGIEDKGNKLIEDFWSYFGGRPDKIKDEEEIKEEPEVELSMHHVSDSSGRMEINEVGRGKLDKSKLLSDDAFIIDAGSSLYVWVGKGANKAEKREAMRFATEYLQNCGRSSNIPIARVMEGSEPSEFWAAFSGKHVGGRSVNSKSWKN